MKLAYYNEIDPFCCQWLKNLIAAGLIPDGDVDNRSITDVKAHEVKAYKQRHWFAGLGGWPAALRLAGWPDDRECDTGSAPCQPLSCAGKQKGHADERHLWPAFYAILAECRPPTIIGEQVAGKLGREWLAGVRADLEGIGYAVGAADLPAACAGAPHRRQRIFWVAVAGGERRNGESIRLLAGEPRQACAKAAGSGANDGMDNAPSPRRNASHQGPEGEARHDARLRGPERGRPDDGLGHTHAARPQERQTHEQHPNETAAVVAPSPWGASRFIPCADGKARRVPLEPAFQPLVDARDGARNRVGILRAAGNSICVPTAATFLRAVMVL